MTDAKFSRLLVKLHKSFLDYRVLLSEAEDEYKRRYGNYPSDVDDDFWLDSFHISPSKTTLKQVEEAAKK